ncbi:MAG: hypothetical protein PVG39_17735 [Desulfobacteraceae bacterium]|jgi:hypothetical protein
MRKIINIIVLISILPLFIMTGCVSTGKTVSEGEKVQYYRPPALSDDILNKRVDVIKNLLKEDSLPDDRKEAAVSVLKAYDKLKSLNDGNITEKEYRKTVKILFDTLVMIEQQYFYGGIVSGDKAGEIIIENYSGLKKQIYEDYFAGNFTAVISGCDDLISRFGKSGLTPDLGIILVEALSKSNIPSDALAVARSILGAAENRPDLILLLTDAIELEVKMGNMEEAGQLYEKLVDHINENNNLYQKAGNLLSGSQGEEPVIDESVKEKITEMAPEKIILMEQLIDKVNTLISRKDFSAARLELVRQRLRAEEGPELVMIEQLWKNVDKAEEQFSSKSSNDKLIIEDARRLIEKEKYKEALDILDPIVAGDKNYEADKVKKEAVEKLITRDKSIAAKLWLAANKESDNQKKRDLLLKARSIFQNLIDKYPASPLIDRVKRNISVVDEELMKLPSADE